MRMDVLTKERYKEKLNLEVDCRLFLCLNIFKSLK